MSASEERGAPCKHLRAAPAAALSQSLTSVTWRVTQVIVHSFEDLGAAGSRPGGQFVAGSDFAVFMFVDPKRLTFRFRSHRAHFALMKLLRLVINDRLWRCRPVCYTRGESPYDRLTYFGDKSYDRVTDFGDQSYRSRPSMSRQHPPGSVVP